MVALLGDVDAGFGLILLIVFLVILVKGISSRGGGNGLSWADKCRGAYKYALKDRVESIVLRYTLEEYYGLSPKEREIFLLYEDYMSPLQIGKKIFSREQIMLIRGMQLEHDKEKKKRARRIARLQKQMA